jgi:hypothetical protein
MNASRARRAGRLGLGVTAILGLLPACNPERLIVIKVDPSDELKHDVSVSIATLEGRKSPHYPATQHLDFTDRDGGTTIFPAFLGIYLRERSAMITVHVFAYAANSSAPVAAGQQDLMLNDERTQEFFAATEEVVLQSCADNPLCGTVSSADGGDAGSEADGETGFDVGSDTDAGIDGDARFDGDAGFDGPSVDVGPIPPGCTSYCGAVTSACGKLFPGETQCERSCASAQLGTTTLPLNCLISDAQLAQNDPTQCLNASLVSPDCVTSRCNVYCALGSVVCGGQEFSSNECGDICSSLTLGSVESPRGDDSLLCRLSWLGDATLDPSLCTRALPAGPCQAR